MILVERLQADKHNSYDNYRCHKPDAISSLISCLKLLQVATGQCRLLPRPIAGYEPNQTDPHAASNSSPLPSPLPMPLPLLLVFYLAFMHGLWLLIWVCMGIQFVSNEFSTRNSLEISTGRCWCWLEFDCHCEAAAPCFVWECGICMEIMT